MFLGLGVTIEGNTSNLIKCKVPMLDDIVVDALISSPLDIRQQDNNAINIKEGTLVILLGVLNNTDSWVVIGSYSSKNATFWDRIIENRDNIKLLSKKITIANNKNSGRDDKEIEETPADELLIQANKVIMELKTLKITNGVDEMVSLIIELASQVLALANATSAHHVGAIVVSAQMSQLINRISAFKG